MTNISWRMIYLVSIDVFLKNNKERKKISLCNLVENWRYLPDAILKNCMCHKSMALEYSNIFMSPPPPPPPPPLHMRFYVCLPKFHLVEDKPEVMVKAEVVAVLEAMPVLKAVLKAVLQELQMLH